MAFYQSPFTRTARRREWPYAHTSRDDDWATESDVWVPINVRAEAEAYIITALLPGVKTDDLSIQIVNETVTLQGEIKAVEGDQDGYLLRECPTGKFMRALRLPEPLNAAKAEADLTNGVLTLCVPKAEEARPRTIKVNAAK